jgi:glycosyltransferase involved in cell wall biosynthesis
MESRGLRKGQRRRIYLLTHSIDERGGIQRSVATLANGLARRHEVEIISVYRHRDRPPLDLDARVRLTYLLDRRSSSGQGSGRTHGLERRLDQQPARLVGGLSEKGWSLLTELRLLLKLKTLRPGIMISNRPILHMFAGRYAPSRVRVLALEHGTLESRGEGKQTGLRKYGSGLAALVTVNDEDRNAYARHLQGIVSRVRAIPNAVPDLSLPPEDGQRQPVITAAGTLLPRKGFDRLIRAFGRVAEEHPGWALHIYGRGRERQQLRRLIQELGLADKVSLMGFTDDIGRVLARSSIVAVSSRRESFGLVIVEAMSCGVPVVSFDCPNGPRQIITHGQDGFLVPDGDLEAFSCSLLRLVEDEHLRSSMGVAARSNVRRFMVERVIDEWEMLFDEVTQSPATSS